MARFNLAYARAVCDDHDYVSRTDQLDLIPGMSPDRVAGSATFTKGTTADFPVSSVR